MMLNIDNLEADRLAHELTALTGESVPDAVVRALRERLAREQQRRQMPRLRDQLRAIRQRCAALPVVDSRPAEEILGYDEMGVPR